MNIRTHNKQNVYIYNPLNLNTCKVPSFCAGQIFYIVKNSDQHYSFQVRCILAWAIAIHQQETLEETENNVLVVLT